MSKSNPFRYFKTSAEIIRLAVMMYVRFPLSLRNVEDLLHERGINISHETVRFWWNRFGPIFATEIRQKRVDHMRAGPQWRWHVDEVFVKINGERHYLWRTVDHEGEVLEAVVTKRRNKRAELYTNNLTGPLGGGRPERRHKWLGQLAWPLFAAGTQHPTRTGDRNCLEYRFQWKYPHGRQAKWGMSDYTRHPIVNS